MISCENIRVAWLLPIAWFYWQPVLSEFTRLFPSTTVFTGRFPGFAKGLENSINVELVGETNVVGLTKAGTSYGDHFTYLSPAIAERLLKLKPNVIFTSSFGVWTLLAILFKFIGGWRIVIAYEGSSPGVDYRNSAVRLFVRRAMVWLADAYITNSQAGRDYLVDILRARSERVFLQPYEIPDEKTLPGYGAVAEEISSLPRPLFLFVGHLVPRKGIPLLLQACVTLQARGYTHYSLVVVGDGPQQDELKDFCQEQGLSDRVRWMGRVSYDQIGSYFKDTDVFVFPTMEDTWGVVTLEAMLLGKPILCSKGAGTSELVVHGENGYVFPPDDAVELADLMQKFLDHPELIPAMGARSQQIMRQYTPEAAAQSMVQITKLVMA
jgi:glycosyltransferase involved in cell wall biosynthesis